MSFCRQIAAHNPKLLIIFDIYENNAYEIQQELIRKYPNLKLEVLIGSVRNTSRIESVMEYYRPDVVFHAQHINMCRLWKTVRMKQLRIMYLEPIKTARAADKYGVKKFVLISTDKAVNPTNIMGASKRMCEMIVQTFSKYSRTEYVIVRFGNVLGSNGSVIPLFKKQMEAGGPSYSYASRYYSLFYDDSGSGIVGITGWSLCSWWRNLCVGYGRTGKDCRPRKRI